MSFLLALTVILVWLVTGPFFNFCDTWQLVINTATTIVTFLMVFLIQSTQNRDTVAIQVKLDELIRSVKGAHNTLLDLEELSEEELARVRASYIKLASLARRNPQDESCVGCPELDEEKAEAPVVSIQVERSPEARS